MIEQITIRVYQTFAEFNDSSMAGLFLYPASVVDAFIPLILFAIFSIVLMSTFFGQQRLTGSGDIFASFAVSSFFTSIIAIIMSLVTNLINPTTLIITIGIAVMSVVILFTRS